LKLKEALEDVLVDYEFLAGRIKMNSETNRLEIDCNAEGVGFVVASSEYKLDQLGNLAYPNQAFVQFVHKTKDFLKIGDIPLCVVQVQCFTTSVSKYIRPI
jgi:omega-hydroxypalmitate O-feruloyl transferase